MLLMAFLTASQIDEVEILERMSAIVARLQAEFGNRQQSVIPRKQTLRYR